MTRLRPAPVSTGQLTYSATENLLVAEASSLPPFGRVYDDACDEGLTVVSAHTGREVVFVVEDTVYSDDGELVCWDLRPAARDLRDNGFRLRVFND